MAERALLGKIRIGQILTQEDGTSVKCYPFCGVDAEGQTLTDVAPS